MPYNAFISYSHTADSTSAAALQSALHRFAKPWYKLRALHLFRDQTNLAVNPALWSSIRDALDQSLFFILLASPEAAASPWVAKETDYWLGRNGPSRILIVLTGGTLQWSQANGGFTPATNALPSGLLRAFAEEPLFLDISWARQSVATLGLREPRFHEAVLQLAATLHNRPKDELDGVDIRLQRQTRLLAGLTLLLIVTIAVFAAWQFRRSVTEGNQQTAAGLAAACIKMLNDHPDRARDAAFLAIESNHFYPSFNGNQALRASVSLLPIGAQFYAPQSSDPAERVRDLAFSPNGSTLAAARDDGTTELFDLTTHKRIGYIGADPDLKAKIELAPNLQELSFDSNAAVSVAFNFTGSLLASGSRDGVVHIWSYPAGDELLRVLHAAPVAEVTFRPRSNQLATAGDDGHVRIFDVAHAQVVVDFKCPDKVVSVSFSPDGSMLAARSSDGTISIFDVSTRKLIRTLGGGDAAFNIVFSGDGQRLATASGDYAFVWEVATGKQLLKATHAASSKTLTPQQWITDVALSADGKFLAYATRDDSLAHVWNVDIGRQILALKHDAIVAAVTFNKDGTKLGTGSYDGTSRIWALPSGNEIGRTAHPQGSEAVAFSPDGQRFAAGGMEGTISASESGRADRPAYFEFLDDVRSVVFSPDGQLFAMGSLSEHWSPLVRVAKIDGTGVRDIEFHGAPVIDDLFFLDHNHLLAQWSSELFLVTIDKSAVTHLPPLSRELRIDPSGKVLAVQQDGATRLYSLPGLQPGITVAGTPSKLLRTAAGGKLLAFETNGAPGNSFIEIWDTSTKSRISRVSLSSEWNHLAIDPSGTILFTTRGPNLQTWELPSGKPRFTVTSDGSIDRVFPNSSSSSFATTADRRLTVWDTATKAPLAELPGSVAAFSPDGKYLLTNDTGRSAALWLWRSNDLRDQACARLMTNLSRSEWISLFPGRPYHQSCPNLPVPAN
jgi:WD40 repeat protein